jgi:hypothetical protein
MRAGKNGVEPTFFSRHECKYLVSELLLPELRAFLRPFTQPDAFAARYPTYRYPVCSLYLDSDDLLLYHQVVRGEKKRFKLRVRTYSDDPDTPAYFEVKSKVDAIVHKRRAAVDRRRAVELLSQGWAPYLSDLGVDDREDLDEFLQHAMLVGARPVLRVKYQREAYQGTGDEPTRLTIDTELVHAVTLGPDFAHTSGRWARTPIGGCVIEIKFTERFPWWIQELVRTFGLRQRAVPKYALSAEHLLQDGRRSVLALGGMLLPPREATS